MCSLALSPRKKNDCLSDFLRANMSLHKWSEFSFMLIALAFEKSFTNSLESCGVLLEPAAWLQSIAALMASLSYPSRPQSRDSSRIL